MSAGDILGFNICISVCLSLSGNLMSRSSSHDPWDSHGMTRLSLVLLLPSSAGAPQRAPACGPCALHLQPSVRRLEVSMPF